MKWIPAATTWILNPDHTQHISSPTLWPQPLRIRSRHTVDKRCSLTSFAQPTALWKFLVPGTRRKCDNKAALLFWCGVISLNGHELVIEKGDGWSQLKQPSWLKKKQPEFGVDAAPMHKDPFPWPHFADSSQFNYKYQSGKQIHFCGRPE